MMKKILSLSMMLSMLFLGACTDDDAIFDPEVEQPEELPVDDVVKTTIDQTFAVIGSTANFDEAGASLLNRLKGQRYELPATGFSLSNDVELVLMDNETLVNLEEEDITELRYAFDRGAVICLQKPHALATAFLYMAMNGALEGAFKPEETQAKLSSTRAEAGDGDDVSAFFPYEMVCMKQGQEVIKLLDVYDGKEQNLTVTNGESKETHDIIVTPREPTAYEYGLYAEDIAQWINQTAGTKTRRGGIVTRADETDSPIQSVTVVPCYVDPVAIFKSRGITVDEDKRDALAPRYTSAKVRLWTTVAYNFDTDEDYYHIIMEQEFNAGTDIYTKNMQLNKDWYATGFTFGGQDVCVRWMNGGSNLNLPLKDEWNRQPNNEGTITSTEEIGWNIKSKFSKGVISSLYDALTPIIVQTGVTMPHKEVSYALNTNYRCGSYQDWTSWEYNIDGPKVDKGKVIEPAPGSPSIALSTCRQAWNWLVPDTKKTIKDDYIPLEFMALIGFKARYCIYSRSKVLSGMMLINKDYGYKNIQLPVPARYSKNYSVVCSNILSGNWEKIEKQFNKSKAYSDLAVQYCAANEQRLDDNMKDRWNIAIAELKNMKLKLPDMGDEVLTVKVMDNSGKQIGTTLYVNKHGVYTAQVGSYYLDDGTVLPNDVELTDEQKKHCLGIVCILRDEESTRLSGPGNVGYVVALHDANDKPCAWGACDNDDAQLMFRMLFAPGFLGSGYHQNYYGFKYSYEFSSPAADYAMNYANTLPSKQGAWFMPTVEEMRRAMKVIPASVFEKAGGEAFDVNKKYATSSMNFVDGDFLRGEYLEHDGNGWVKNSDIELLKQEVFYVRPFMDF